MKGALLKDLSQVCEDDILLLRKVNEFQTMRPTMTNVVIVRRCDFNDELFVLDYGGYANVPGTKKGNLSIPELFEKWDEVIKLGELYRVEVEDKS